MTDNFKPINNQNSPSNYCNESYYYDCYVFPEINYIIIHAFSASHWTSMYVKIGTAISQQDTLLIARIWQNGRFMGFDRLTIATSNWY